MGTPGSGRKRMPMKDRFSAEDEALSNIAREAEARLAAKRAARAEARDIRMRELERQQKEASLYDGGLYNPYGSRTPSEYSYYSLRTSSGRSSPA
ncbi:PREDICTED: leucine-rich repeat flightless-interacting protein 2-like, partial [Galeopterus variegatus]|uniref:Leucine-rich repeat flightless-interacting protein 2 n=1 Tax=Galeopterus variegatus TaxID=482537 RepID=A0ABM0SEC7_GALVR